MVKIMESLSEVERSPPDRVAVWPVAFLIFGLGVLVVGGGWPDKSLLFTLASLPFLFIAIIAAAVGFSLNAWKRHWRRAASLAVLPVFFACAVLGGFGRIGAHIRLNAEI